MIVLACASIDKEAPVVTVMDEGMRDQRPKGSDGGGCDAKITCVTHGSELVGQIVRVDTSLPHVSSLRGKQEHYEESGVPTGSGSDIVTQKYEKPSNKCNQGR